MTKQDQTKNNPSIETQDAIDATESPDSTGTPALPETPIEKHSDNYFEQVNHEFGKELMRGNFDKEVVNQIAERNEKSFISKIIDGIKNPSEAFKWIQTNILIAFAGSWLGDIFGVKEKLNKLKEGLMEFIKNPLTILTGIFGALAGFKLLKRFGNLASISPTKLSGLLRIAKGTTKLAGLAALGYGASKLYQYFNSNESEVNKMPENKDDAKTWWSEIFKKAEIDKDLNENQKKGLLAVIMEEESIDSAFKDLKEEDIEDAENQTDTAPKPNEEINSNQESYEHPTYGKMIKANKYTEKKFETTKNKIKDQTEIIIHELRKREGITETFLLGTAISVGPIKPILAIKDLSTTGLGLSLQTIKTFLKAPVWGLNNPLKTTFILLGILETLKNLDNFFVPEDDTQFVEYLKDIYESEKEDLDENMKKAKEKLSIFFEENEINEEETIEEVYEFYQNFDQNINRAEKELLKLKENIFNFWDLIVDELALSPEKKFKERHKDAMQYVIEAINIDLINRGERRNKEEQFTKLKEYIENLISKIKNSEDITNNDLTKLAKLAEELDYKIIETKEYLYITRIDEDGHEEISWQFMVNPNINNEDEKKELANLLLNKDLDTYSEIYELSILGAKDSLREFIHEDEESFKNGKLTLVLTLTGLYIVGGITKKFIAGPKMGLELMKYGASLISGDKEKKDGQWKQIWIEYGDIVFYALAYNAMSILPKIFAYAVKPKILRPNLGISALKMIGSSLFAPISSINFILNLGRDYLPRGLNDLTRVKENFKYSSPSNFHSFITKRGTSSHLRQATWQLNRIERRVCHRKSRLRDYNLYINSILTEGGHDLTRLRIDDVDSFVKFQSIAKQDEIIRQRRLEIESFIKDPSKIPKVSLLTPSKTKTKVNPSTSSSTNPKASHSKSSKKKKKGSSRTPSITPRLTDISMQDFEKLTEEQKIQKIKDIDTKIARAERKHKQKIDRRIATMNNRKQPYASNQRYKQLIADQNRELSKLIGERLNFTEKLLDIHPDLDLAKNGIGVDEALIKRYRPDLTINPRLRQQIAPDINSPSRINRIKARIKSPRMRKAGKFGLIAGIFGFAMYQGESSAHSSENDENEADTNRSQLAKYLIEQENSGQSQEEIKEEIEETLSEMTEEDRQLLLTEFYLENEINEKLEKYEDFFKIFSDPDTMGQRTLGIEGIKRTGASALNFTLGTDIDDPEISRIEYQKQVDKFVTDYINDTNFYINFLQSNATEINKLFLENEELQKNGIPIISWFLKIEWDENKKTAYLSYAKKEELEFFLYDIKENPDGGLRVLTDTVIESLPIISTGFNVFRAYEASQIRRNDSMKNYYLNRGTIDFATDIISIKAPWIGTALSVTGNQLIERTINHFDEANTASFKNRFYAGETSNSPRETILKVDHDAKNDMLTNPTRIEDSDEERIEKLEYKMAILINNFAWSQCEYQIIDRDNVIIKRKNSNHIVEIYMEEDGTWNLKDELKADGGYTNFEQAFVLANLSNYTMEWLDNEDTPLAITEKPFFYDTEAEWSPVKFKGKKTLGQISNLNYHFIGIEAYMTIYALQVEIPETFWVINLLNRTYKKWSNITDNIQKKTEQLKKTSEENHKTYKSNLEKNNSSKMWRR